MEHQEHIEGLPPPESPEPTLPTQTLVLIAGLLVGALSFILFGIGYALGWGSDTPEEAPADTLAVQQPKAPAEPAPPELFGAEPIPSAEADAPREVVSNEALYGAEAVPEVATGSGAEAGTGTRGSGGGGRGNGGGPNPLAGSGPSAPVTFDLVHYDRVELKLGGKVFRLGANKTLQIRPGSYRIQLRHTSSDPWVSAGLLSVELGSSYRVKLFDPPLAHIERKQ